ncbi:hypothetical protein [Mycolicibacterium sp. XJ870]
MSSTKCRTELVRGGMTVAYMAGQLLFFGVVAALIGGVIWAVLVMRKPRPPFKDVEDFDDDHGAC